METGEVGWGDQFGRARNVYPSKLKGLLQGGGGGAAVCAANLSVVRRKNKIADLVFGVAEKKMNRTRKASAMKSSCLSKPHVRLIQV
ncbi:hypothetical protein CEXT_300081 [Caerostris extrusa]|uniref:Uncharacterized protein n=1 Tax=Caerostris extrusa TaxID=172846 RepID=A0AAV4MS59_CAEEX|nr:hypothetical protein CEXT_300081 [Caerostris extrusa]